ncbi:hypothetical protein JCM19038_61 [Geomicrobium sp. JCM 19038]|nr:hypothetical protein JCM19055_2016 [Geomicrobium sp. JCM 19055]GAK06368.1 hypothetical protein JCM19038_61 [Geomicrobium sp. JCM 19038]
MHCPNCMWKDIGKIGANQYYCWKCCIELVVKGSTLSVYQVEEDGSLVSLDDVFSEAERESCIEHEQSM